MTHVIFELVFPNILGATIVTGNFFTEKSNFRLVRKIVSVRLEVQAASWLQINVRIRSYAAHNFTSRVEQALNENIHPRVFHLRGVEIRTS